MSNPTPSRYQWTYQGVSFDFYRLCEILGIVSHAQAHALKKVIRAGQSVKPLVQDIDEAIACLRRWREMVVDIKFCADGGLLYTVQWGGDASRVHYEIELTTARSFLPDAETEGTTATEH